MASASPQVRLFCAIVGADGKEHYYQLEKIEPSPAVLIAWKLEKKDGVSHHVSEDSHGLHCDCGDYVWRKKNTAELCKHCRALQELGLIGKRSQTHAVEIEPQGSVESELPF
jgi:hypothetical protein